MYSREYCKCYNEVTRYSSCWRDDEGKRVDPNHEAHLRRKVIPQLSYHGGGEDVDMTLFRLTHAQLRPEFFRERGLDPSFLVAGTILVGGLKRYASQLLVLTRRIKIAAAERTFIIEAYGGRFPLTRPARADVIDSPIIEAVDASGNDQPRSRCSGCSESGESRRYPALRRRPRPRNR